MEHTAKLTIFSSKKIKISHEQILLWFHGNWLEIYETN